ncbi:Gti1/Pac2 family-domain-containing protein [Chytriomyces sp. MP71]|nr:Gti1/Pac2 family-domain-containing protein [Chytriomyces sp. MP71]
MFATLHDHIIIGSGTSSVAQQTPLLVSAEAKQSRRFTETFRGFVKDPLDAQLLIEACIEGILQPLNIVPMSLSDLSIRSGTVLVFAENSNLGQMVRWRDGCRWSASRLQGPFLLYREVEANSGPQPTAMERDIRFCNTVVRGKTRFVPNGLAKRTLTLSGSDGNRYRVISYFYPCDVSHLYGDPLADEVEGKAARDENQNELQTPSGLAQFARFLAKGSETMQSVSMPDLSWNALLRNSTNAQAAVQQQQQQKQIQQQQQELQQQVQQQRQQAPQVQLSIKPAIQLVTPQASHISLPSLPTSPWINTIIRKEEQHSASFQHPIFQLLSTAERERCACGGLGLRRHVDYFEKDPFWTEFPVSLAPLRKRKWEHV